MSSNLKIKLKCTGDRATRDGVLKVLSECQVNCSRLYKVNNELILIYCNSANDVDLLFSTKCGDLLKRIDCVLKTPLDLQAKRSFIVRRVDSVILNHSIESISDELEKKNTWLVVRNIIKFPNSNVIKIVCGTQDMVTKALSNGIFMFSLSISPANIFADEYVHVLICYKCYKWNDHLTENCREDPSFKICSLCSGVHSYKECKSPEKCCVNCKGPHSTLSYSCPKRKEEVKKLKSPPPSSFHRPSQPSTSVPYPTSVPYSNTLSTHEILPDLPEGNLNEVIVKASMCMVMAALKGVDDEEYGFQSTLDKLLTANNLPLLRMGDVKPPNLRCLREMSRSSHVLVEPSEAEVPTHSEEQSRESPATFSRSSADEQSINSPATCSSSSSTAIKYSPKIEELKKNSPVAAALQKFAKIDQKATLDPNSYQRRLRYTSRKLNTQS